MSEPWFRFTVAVHGDEDGALWAEVETWPGTFASGGTFEELWEALGESILLVEGRHLFDERAQQFLGISGEEFVRRYDAGELDPDDDHVIGLVMLLPFYR